MFDALSTKLEKAIHNLKGKSRITEINVLGTIKDIRRALIEADVHYRIAKDFTDEIKAEAIGQGVITAISPGQLLIKIANDKLTALMGGKNESIKLQGTPAIIMIAGLQGSGKTTFSAKLARQLKREGKQPMLVACDTYRPAAVDQLKTLGEQLDIEVYAEPGNNEPLSIAKAALEHASQNNSTVLIVDTAGRLAIDEKMMTEIRHLKKLLSPSEIIFVADAMTGQDAVNTAKTFNEQLDFDGIALTKLDGDARGGAALSIRKVTGKPIKFISTGEKPEDLEKFFPDRMAGRILGMGDVVGLVEKAQQNFDEEETKRLNKKIRKNQFDLTDFLKQLQQIKKMGDVKSLLTMIPGVSKKMGDNDFDSESLKPLEAIICSMTYDERGYPDKINLSRKKRIANGSGTTLEEVNQLLKQFNDMRKMIKKMNRTGDFRKALSSMPMP